MGMRFKTVDRKTQMRVLTGKEVLAFAGWANEFWRQDVPPLPESELRAMAGNCFNGFSFAAVVTAIIGTAGCESDTVPAPLVNTEREDEGSSACSDGSSSTA